MKKIIFSRRAKEQIIRELDRYPLVETGGVLLGYYNCSSILIEEAVDGGDNAVREEGFFQYDYGYVEEESLRICQKYKLELFVVGLWHKHNHDLEPAFSFADVLIHEDLVEQCGFGISCIFQKKANGDYQVHILDSDMNNYIIPSISEI